MLRTLLLFSLPLLAYAAGSVSGTLTINGKKHNLTHVTAFRMKDSFEPKKQQTRLLVTTAPVPAEVLESEFEMMRLGKERGIFGLMIDLGDSSSGINYVLLSSSDATISGSETPSPLETSVKTPTRIEGEMKMAQDKEVGSTRYRASFKVATDVTPMKVDAPPTAAETAAAQQHPATKAYLAFVQAVRTGNKANMRKGVVPEKAAMMDGPDFAEQLKFIQTMMSKNIKVVKATENGDKATLMATGMDGSRPTSGKITMKMVEGTWRVDKESWSGAGN